VTIFASYLHEVTEATRTNQKICNIYLGQFGCTLENLLSSLNVWIQSRYMLSFLSLHSKKYYVMSKFDIKFFSKFIRPMKNLAHEKSSAMYLSIITTWILCLIWCDPRLFYVFQNMDTILEKTLMIIFTICLNIFWFYGFYHVYLLIFGSLSRKELSDAFDDNHTHPKVAILYTTCNDFLWERALTCIQQDYPNYHVFILDDSSDRDLMEKVDLFQREHQDLITLIRRESRDGFKAGAINNVVSNYAQDYEYFAISDSDGSLPPDFLTKIIGYFATDAQMGFIQPNHENNSQEEKLARDLGVSIDVTWRHQLPVRNKYGFVMCLGHGAVIRRDAWEKIGGFPQIVSEDLALTMRMLEQGYRGYFAKDVICGADFPEDFATFRKRFFRWVKADCETLLREFPRFMRAKRPSCVEKTDALVREARLPLTSLFLPFVLIVTFLSSQSSEFNYMFSWDFALLSLLTSFAPWYSFVVELWHHPLKGFNLVAHSMMAYCSLSLLAFLGVLTFLFTRRAYFTVTGWREGRENLEVLGPGHPAVGTLEISVGLFLGYISLVALNFVVLAIASALILAPLINKFGWENRLVAFLVYIPFLLTLTGLVVSAFGICGVPGQFYAISGFSVILF
jgi:cellulose synthase/poly-beta-1,6-N-acetylglucosamine synthase-like glycosyltransferase